MFLKSQIALPHVSFSAFLVRLKYLQFRNFEGRKCVRKMSQYRFGCHGDGHQSTKDNQEANDKVIIKFAS